MGMNFYEALQTPPESLHLELVAPHSSDTDLSKRCSISLERGEGGEVFFSLSSA